jgi:hypothetical protein
LAGDKVPTEGEGNGVQTQKGARLQKAIAELKAAEKVFPLTGPIAEGLLGAKEAAIEEISGSLNSLRGKTTGLEQIGKDIRDKAAKIEEHSKKVADAEEKLGQTGRELDEKATGAAASAAAAVKSAEEVNTAITSLRIKVGEKEYSGVQALSVLGKLVTRIPATVKDEVEIVVSATVDGEKKKGADLIAAVVLKADAAEAAAGKAVDDAEHAIGLIELAGEQVNDARAQADKAVEAAGNASGKADEAAQSAGLVEGLKAELAKTKKALDVAVGMIMTVLEKNGLDAEITIDEKRGIVEAASKGDFVSDILTVEEDTSGAGDSA